MYPTTPDRSDEDALFKAIVLESGIKGDVSMAGSNHKQRTTQQVQSRPVSATRIVSWKESIPPGPFDLYPVRLLARDAVLRKPPEPLLRGTIVHS